MKHTSVRNTFNILKLTTITSIFLLFGCQKIISTQNNTSILLDSIITGNLSLHYVYDDQQRVIEERFNRLDSPMLIRRVYEYLGNNPLPFKRNHFSMANPSPDFSCVFSYNNNGQKIFDSSYYTPGSGFVGYSTTRFDYSVPSKIVVFKKLYYYTTYDQMDTIFLNNNSNIDSIKTYWGSNNSFWNCSAFLQYDPRLNKLKSLSINQCNYYMSVPNNVGNFFAGAEFNGIQGIILDYFNSNYLLNLDYYNSSHNVFISYQTQYQFNSDDLPISRTMTDNSGTITTTRLVYR